MEKKEAAAIGIQHLLSIDDPMAAAAAALAATDDLSKRGYRCQRCRNHNVDVARKGHVDQCPFRACRCSQCVLVERRTDTHRLLKQKAILNSVFERKSFVKTTDGKLEPLTLASALGIQRATAVVNRKSGGDRKKHEKRTLRCAKCSNHDVFAPLKNHKQACPYRHCRCSMCDLVDDYRNILKDQIKTRRMQNRQRAALNRLVAATSSGAVDLAPRQSSRPLQLTTSIKREQPETVPSSPISRGSPLPLRKSVIVSSSTSPSSTSSSPKAWTPESLPDPMMAAAQFAVFNPIEEDKAKSNAILLGHLAALSAFWQQQQQQHRATPIQLSSLPYVAPQFNFYNALSHGLHMQMS